MTGISLTIYPLNIADHLLMTFPNDRHHSHLVVNTAADEIAHQVDVGDEDRLETVQDSREVVGIVFSL